jgi:hypothetical protein
MSVGRFATWRRVVALAPLLLLVVSVPAQKQLRCRIDGRVRSVCCCPPDTRVAPTQTVVKAADCCDSSELTASERPAIEAARTPALDIDWSHCAAWSAPVPFLALAAPPLRMRPSRVIGSPREGPPIVLLKHAFLI